MPSKQRVQLKNRVRAYKPKVKTGCITCRIRRIKCDEAKPDCQKCTSTGRKCDGYLVPSSFPKDLASLLKRSPLPEPLLMQCDLERRSFDFFCRRTVKVLSGIFDPTFWTRLVLQATHHEPAIKHAVIALGALHETSELRLREEPSVFAMQQYGKAIRCLVKPIQEKQKQAADVALITCVLFVCFEIMRGHYGTAISHIEGGVKIISEIQPSSKPAETWSISTIPYAEPSILNQTFVRLDRQACEVLSGRKRLLLDQVPHYNASGHQEDVPLAIKSLEEARNSLDHIRTFFMRFMKSAASQPSFSDLVNRALTQDVLKILCSAKLRQWSAAFESFISNSSEFDVIGQEAILVLKMHRVNMGVTMTIDEERSYADETVWDQYESQFEEITSHAQSITDLHIRSCEKEGRGLSTCHLDLGIIFPLFLVSSKCRNGTIRRKTIELLRAVDRQEGVLNSVLTARIAERLMCIEEEGLIGEEAILRASDIPRENRLGGMVIQCVTDRRLHLTYNLMGKRLIGGDGYEGGPVVTEEWLEW